MAEAGEAGVDIDKVLEMMRLANARPCGLDGVVEQLVRSPGRGS